MEYLADNASFYIWFLIAALVLVTMMNVVGLDISKWLHNAGAFGMWLPVAVVIVTGFVGWPVSVQQRGLPLLA